MPDPQTGEEPRIGGESGNCPRCGMPLNDLAHEVLPDGCRSSWSSQTGGEFANGGESGGACTCTLGRACGPGGCDCTTTIMDCAVHGSTAAALAEVDTNRRRVLVVWLRDVGLDGCADNLAAETGDPAHVAYEIADQAENELPGGVSAPLVWHLRDWADRHDKLGKE